MALRARLVAPPPPPEKDWPWHTVDAASIPISALLIGDRRMEAENFLSTGYGLRIAIENKSRGWKPLSALARTWQPNRLKGIQVSREYGTPFLAATQVYDVRPIPRKWLSLERTEDASNRFVSDGTILVTCSGSVGRPTLAYGPHKSTLVSHDLLRVKPLDERQHGWVYAFLHSPQARAMTKGAQYGHIIKHLETSHLDAIPVPLVSDTEAADFSRRVAKIVRLRNEAYRLTLEAEERFETVLGEKRIADWGELGFEVKVSSALAFGRRRFEAAFHNPGVSAIKKHLKKTGKGFTTISNSGYEVWLPSRFRRIPATDGVLFVDSADLTEVNPDLTKHIADGDFGDPYRARVDEGWILMARSGQTYGIIGTCILAGKDLEGKVISDHVMRIKPTKQPSIAPGYLVTALTHPRFGRPLVKALAYGSSIPEIEVADIQSLEIIRIEPKQESAIAELAEESAKARAAADIIEREIATDAEKIIAKFIEHGSRQFDAC